jgi:hypothetical protein
MGAGLGAGSSGAKNRAITLIEHRLDAFVPNGRATR